MKTAKNAEKHARIPFSISLPAFLSDDIQVDAGPGEPLGVEVGCREVGFEEIVRQIGMNCL